MKKSLIGLLLLVMAMALNGCQLVSNITDTQEESHEKVEDPRELLDKILEHIADADDELAFADGTLVDKDLGIPRYEVLAATEIEHFDGEDLEGGYLVRSVVSMKENPHLLVIVKGVDADAALRLKEAMFKVRSDQHAELEDAEMMTSYILDTNEIIRQGNFVFYATWEGAEEILYVFESYVK